jgi:hypothetical protein
MVTDRLRKSCASRRIGPKCAAGAAGQEGGEGAAEAGGFPAEQRLA